MRVPIYKRLMEARDNPNADLHKLTTDILALFSVVGTSVCDEPDEPVDRENDEEIIDLINSILSNGKMQVETVNEAVLVKLMEIRNTPVKYDKSYRDIDKDFENYEKFKARQKQNLIDMMKGDEELGLYEKPKKLYTIEDIERCVENWGLCKVEREYIEKFLETNQNK